MQDEYIDIVDRQGNKIRTAPRSEAHGNPELIHKVVHVLVFNSKGYLLLQKRSMSKDVAPGRWDTSVGGHVNSDEPLIDAAAREMEEELGITCGQMEFLYSYIHSNSYETEMVFTHRCIHEGPFSFNRDEIDDLRFWSMQEIRDAIGSSRLSDNFESEIEKYLEHTRG
ncbi:MAG: NUDIX domain-containing protein [Nitrospiraceae bacterium]|nr:NUDIX domain-containing protein [Nitrospiraceae bacterium]